MANRKRKGNSEFVVYKAYRFMNKDPVIDQLRTIAQDQTGDRKLTGATLKKIEVDGGPSASCSSSWFGGKTRKPQNCTVEAFGRALGMRREWVNDK